MTVREGSINGLLIIEPRVFHDHRGYFFESFNARAFREATGIDADFVQDNQANSSYGTLRGLHFQKGEAAQAKLIRVSRGTILDVAVDIRPGSPTFGRHMALELSEDNFLQLFIPRGFAHGYIVKSEVATVEYKTDNYYNPGAEGAILWNDPDLGIDWQLRPEEIILSEKDRKNPLLRELI